MPTINIDKSYIPYKGNNPQPAQRLRLLYFILALLGLIFLTRLFYLQVVKHSYYQDLAKQKQTSQYTVAAERGQILLQSSEGPVPIVLNESKYLVIADPKLIKNPKSLADTLSGILNINKDEVLKNLTNESHFSIIAKKIDKSTKDRIEAQNLKGIYIREVQARTYPQGQLAAQILGFVNDDGIGQYGIEGYLNEVLSGKSGELKAVTDANGVPLAANNSSNRIRDPIPGKNAVLTIDLSLQQTLEDLLKKGVESAKSNSGGAVIVETKTGAIKAMASWPNFNPGEFSKVSDPKLFQNPNVSDPLEIGSVMKPLTTAAALNTSSVNVNSSYYDPGFVKIDNAIVSNVTEVSGSGTRSVADILQMSLNTGAVYLLKQMGGGEINEKARTTWYDYLTNHYQFGKLTGVEQEGESAGTVNKPNDGFGLNIQYANMSFGQGILVTPLQLAAAITSVVNGGTYYQPHLLDKYILADGTEEKPVPKIVKNDVISPEVSTELRTLMKYVVSKNNPAAVRAGFLVGGKSGTAQISKPSGGYFEDKFNGTYIGFVGITEPQYTIVVRVNEPNVAGYAGAKAAAPLFANISNVLIDQFGLSVP